MKGHWEQERLTEYQEIEDPEGFFSQMGEEIASDVEQRARSLAGEGPAGEGYLARLQRLNTARLEAEAAVVREYLLPEEPQEAPPEP
jgi:hypothetical protein